MPASIRTSCRADAYGGARVLDDVGLTLPGGEVTCLLGPSGCGKSTLLRIAAGVERQDRGTVRIGGRVVSDATRHVPPEGRSIGLMFQDFALFPHLTVAGNVGFGLGGRDRAGRTELLLARVGLARHADKYPHQLSGGEQQRVALARALAPRPPILLMDEPFSSLDNRLRDGIRDQTLDILKEEGTAVLLVTHEPEEAMRMADRIVLMREGRIVQQGAPYAIYNSPVDKEAAMFFSDVNVVHGVVQDAAADTPFGRFATPGARRPGRGRDRDPAAAPARRLRPQRLRAAADAAGRGAGARPGAPRALRRRPERRRGRHGARRLGAAGDAARRLPAEAGHAALAVAAARPRLRLPCARSGCPPSPSVA